MYQNGYETNITLKICNIKYLENNFAIMEMKVINLKHLIIKEKKQIGIKFYPDKIIQALITPSQPNSSQKFLW